MLKNIRIVKYANLVLILISVYFVLGNISLFASDNEQAIPIQNTESKMIQGVTEDVYRILTSPGYDEYNTREIIVEFEPNSVSDDEKASIRLEMVKLFALKRLVFKEKISDISEIWSFSIYDTPIVVFKTMEQLRKNPKFKYIMYHSIMHLIDGHENPPLPEDGEKPSLTPSPTPSPTPIPNIKLALQIGKPLYTNVINGKSTDNLEKVETHLINGRVLLPVRYVVENLGGTIEWNENSMSISISLNLNTIELKVNTNTAMVNGKSIILDVSPVIKNGRTLVPLRFIAENLGYNVKWIPESKEIYIQ